MTPGAYFVYGLCCGCGLTLGLLFVADKIAG